MKAPNIEDFCDGECHSGEGKRFYAAAKKMAEALESVMGDARRYIDQPKRQTSALWDIEETAKAALLEAGYTEDREPSIQTPLESFDNTQANEEGWALFNDGEIQRLDEGAIIDGVQTGEVMFQSDEEALAHVRMLAYKDNSEYHKLALSMLKE